MNLFQDIIDGYFTPDVILQMFDDQIYNGEEHPDEDLDDILDEFYSENDTFLDWNNSDISRAILVDGVEHTQECRYCFLCFLYFLSPNWCQQVLVAVPPKQSLSVKRVSLCRNIAMKSYLTLCRLALHFLLRLAQ